MKYAKVYACDCRAPHDEVQAHSKHMLYHILNFQCLICVFIAWNSSFDAKATVCTYGVAILYVQCSQCN